jgi:ABC-type branched-subunit amino acid transport system ATPase component/branched-subunit amino acid ABC-type transport system permease component
VSSTPATAEVEGAGDPGRRGPDGPWPALRKVAAPLAPAVAIIAVQQVAFPAPGGIVLRGAIIGGLTALIALGMALVYRANRILNFAQADLGFAPAVLAYLLLDEVGVPWPLAVLAGLAASLCLGAVTERVVIRRFFRAPRLLLTIATIGLSQVLAAGALLIPRLWDRRLISDRIEPPSDVTARIGGVVFDANDLLALAATPVVVVLLAVVLQRSALGTAIRAGADDPDRASLLGIPVQLLHTAVWSVAAGLAFVTMFLRGGILGLPTGELLGFSVLLRSLVALMLGRLTNLVTVATSAVALGVLELGIAWEHSVRLVEPILGLIVVVALLLQRRELLSRDRDAEAWQFSEEVREVPARVRDLPLVRWGRWALLGTVLAFAVVLPHVVSVDRSLRASALLVYAVLGVSLVVLSGWGGHVSLGQVAFFAIGAAVAGWMTGGGADLFPALVGAALVGAVAATVVAVPASRLRGLSLAVTTFALSLATTSYLLNREFFDWVPRGRVERPPLIGGIEVATPTEIYYAALVLLVLVGLAARGIRASRTGRAVIALRDNERSAQGYGLDPVRLRLSTFALAGAIAALAGGLFIHHQQGFDAATYAPIQNLVVFTMVVIGGLSSIAGAVLGATFLLGTRWFLPGDWQILATGTGVLVVLWLAPGGLASLAFRLRDAVLARVAAASGVQADDRAGGATDDVAAEEEHRGPTAEVEAEPAPVADGTGGAPPLLTVEDLDVAYGPVQVLFGIDLEVAEGEAVALLGTNGAGKSTVLRAVSGLLEPSRGRVCFAGEDITGRPPHEIARAGIAQMPGGAGVFPSLTVAENLKVAGWLHRRRPGELAAARADVERLFPTLAERLHQRADTLSGGEQQMLALAMALLTRPRLLLVDELSLGLAPRAVERLLEALDELRDRTTVVLVDQSVNLALEVSDRALFLERGQVRYSGPARELRDRSDLLRSVFLSRAAAAPEDDHAGEATATGRASARAAARSGRAAGTDGSDGAPAPPVLEAVRVSRSFGGVDAVQDVSLQVGRGEIVGLIGPNGAGKTTLFDVLSGFVPAQSGEVRLAGRDVTRARPSRRATAGLGRSFQDARLFPSLTVAEAIGTAHERWVRVRDPLSAAFRLPNAQSSERAVARRVDELVELLGLEAHRASFVGELSTGTRRVVDLACLLAHDPDVVLLDEPAAGIAQREVEALAPLVRRLRDEAGASLLVIEHDLPFVETISDRLVAMDQGRVIAAGAPAEVLEDATVTAAYLGASDTAVRRSDHPGDRPPPAGG